ncbi:hypothetical protein GcM3_054032, partial [Golovinomyces cichoracearum]
ISSRIDAKPDICSSRPSTGLPVLPIVDTSLGDGPNIKFAHDSYLSTIVFLKRRAMMSLNFRIDAALAGIGATIAISIGACQASQTRKGLRSSCYIFFFVKEKGLFYMLHGLSLGEL